MSDDANRPGTVGELWALIADLPAGRGTPHPTMLLVDLDL